MEERATVHIVIIRDKKLADYYYMNSYVNSRVWDRSSSETPCSLGRAPNDRADEYVCVFSAWKLGAARGIVAWLQSDRGGSGEGPRDPTGPAARQESRRICTASPCLSKRP